MVILTLNQEDRDELVQRMGGAYRGAWSSWYNNGLICGVAVAGLGALMGVAMLIVHSDLNLCGPL